MKLAAKYILLLGNKGGAPLPAPTNLSPDNDLISDTTPNLTWDAVIGASDYTVRVYDASDTLVFEDTSATSPVTVSPALDPPDGPFTWTVFANPDGAVATATFEYAATAFLPFVAGIKPAGLIFLGPLRETSGTTAIDYSGEAHDGTYRNVSMLNQGTFLTGEPIPQWVPASNDYLELPAGFLSAFNLDEHVILIWARVRAAGVWTDATDRNLIEINRDGSNRAYIRKGSANNQLQFGQLAGGTAKNIFPALSTINWFQVAMKTSRSTGANGELKGFINGVQSGATQTALGTAAGAPTFGVIGAQNISGSRVWDGYEAYAAIWSGAGNLPSDAEIASIYSFLVP